MLSLFPKMFIFCRNRKGSMRAIKTEFISVEGGLPIKMTGLLVGNFEKNP